MAPVFDKENDYEWNIEYYNTLINSFPDFLHFKEYTASFFNQNQISYICFKDATFIGRVAYHEYNGANFVSFQDTYLMRAIIYKRYNFQLYNYDVKTFNDLHITFNERKNGKLTINKKARNLMNFEEIKSFLEWHKQNITYINCENMSFKEQVETMVNTDIFMLVDGGATTNLIFMLPFSGILDILVPLNFDTRFQDLALMADIYHSFISETNFTLMSTDCREKYHDTIAPELVDSPCTGLIHMSREIYVDKTQVLIYLFRLKVTVLYKKYHDISY
ncbi:hypothetical protein WA158_007946 [Blastocystis sp. Blastoise]